ncbi:hypothetical protein C8J56DRAFT_113688 [Mycena floridula]|nr:hypothetical protein C8J56DRAFT_113688 [Mycena floridula]
MRSGRQVFLFRDQDDPKALTGPTLDFRYANCHSSEIHNHLVLNSQRASRVAQLRRHHLCYTGGQIIPFNERVPAGGGKVDGLRPYEGIKADDEENINIIFDHAEDSTAMEQVAQSVHPDLFKQMLSVSEACNSIGWTGATVYRCDG